MSDPILPKGFVPASAPAPSAPAPVPQPDPTPTPQLEPTPIEPAATAPAPAPTPDTRPAIAEPVIDDSVIAKALEVASGGKLTSKDALAEALKRFDEYVALQAKAGELEAKLQVDPFNGNSLAKKFAELATSGASTSELASFVQLQTLDLEKMPPLDAIRMSVQMQNPDWDAAMVDAYLADDLKLANFIEGDQDSVTPKDRVALSQAKNSAINFLSDRKVKAEVPASLEQQNAARIQQEARFTAVKNVADSVAGSFKAMKIGEGDLAFEFPVPDAFRAFAADAVSKMVAPSSAQIDNQLPGAIADQMQRMFVAAHFPQILAAHAKHVESIVREQTVKAQAGADPSTGRVVAKPAPEGQKKGLEGMDPRNLLLRAGQRNLTS